jgi:hypothetical protein
VVRGSRWSLAGGFPAGRRSSCHECRRHDDTAGTGGRVADLEVCLQVSRAAIRPLGSCSRPIFGVVFANMSIWIHRLRMVAVAMGVAGVVLLVVVLIVATVGSGGSKRPARGGRAAANGFPTSLDLRAMNAVGRSMRANRQAALQDAQVLVDRLMLPSRAVRLSREPHGDRGVLSRPATLPGEVNLMDLHRYWRVSDSAAGLYGFIRSHPPAGSTWAGSGLPGEGSQASTLSVTFRWPPVDAVLDSRSLAVTVIELPGGAIGVRADAEVVWAVPRPENERIPAGAHVLDVRIAREPSRSEESSLAITVHNPRTVAEISALIDELPTVQPSASVVCPDLVSRPKVTFTFRGSTNGAPIAIASAPASTAGPLNQCNATSFTVLGRARNDLLDGALVVRKAQALLGVDLTRP